MDSNQAPVSRHASWNTFARDPKRFENVAIPTALPNQKLLGWSWNVFGVP